MVTKSRPFGSSAGVAKETHRGSALSLTKRPIPVEELEEDCGFKFKRVSKAAALEKELPPQESSNEIEVPIAEIEEQPARKNRPEGQRRRRSSFASLAASKAGQRLSSFSVSLSQSRSLQDPLLLFILELPDDAIPTTEYHKHVLPDLPGPIKMRQILLWAVQKIAANAKSASTKPSKTEQQMFERVLNALNSNEITTSWYQRPTLTGEEASPPAGPKNQELLDYLGVYERYTARLRAEMALWHALEEAVPAKVPALPTKLPSVVCPTISSAADLQPLANWISNLPLNIDQLAWTLSVATSFESHAKTFCETVFRQMRQRLFGGDDRPSAMLLLKALSSHQ